MPFYRHVGVETKIGDVELKGFGDRIELPQDDAEEMIRHPRGPALITDDLFQSVGFTESELAKVKKPAGFLTATVELQAKVEQARSLLIKFRAELQEANQ